MARLSDIIESFIKEMLEESEERELEIKRNELANQFSCAPSQINYVLTTRFTTEKGYYIESRRGGGGFIKIKQVQFEENDLLFDKINEKIGDNITYNNALNIIEGLEEAEFITERESNLMRVAINERVLGECIENKNEIRASILKAMLIVVLL